MKKLLVAAIAAASFGLVHAENETTLYGSISYDTAVRKNNDQNGVLKALDENRWNLDTNVIKWGIKGKEEINENLTALYNLEFGANGGKRYAWVALSGPSWGTLKIGTQDSLYKILTNYNDIFAHQSTFWGSTVNYDEGLNRPDRVIAYVSPNFNGFTFAVAGILNGGDKQITDNYYNLNTANLGVGNFTTSNSFGAAQVGLWYAQNGFFAALTYEYVKSDFGYVDDTGTVYAHFGLGTNADNIITHHGTELVAGTVGYSNDQFKVGLGVQHKASDGEKYNLAGEYYYGPHTFRAGYGFSNSKDLRASTAQGFMGGANSTDARDTLLAGTHGYSGNVHTYALGYQYNFSKRTYTFVEGGYIDWNYKKIPYDTYDVKNGYTVRVGLRHDF